MKDLRIVYFSLIVLVFIWAFNNIGSKIIAMHVAPFTAGMLRFALASIALALYLVIMKVKLPKISAKDWLILIWLSFMGIMLLNYFFFISFPYTTVSETFIIVGLNPVLTFLFAVLFINEKWYWSKFFGAVIAFIGVGVAFYHPDIIHSTHLWGDFLFSLSVVAWVIYSISMKGILTRVSPVIVTAYTSIIGTIMLAVMAFSFEKPYADIPKLFSMPEYTHVLWALAYVGVVATAVAYILWTEAVAKVGASSASVFIALVPPLGVVFSSLILHEKLYPNLIFGLVFIVIGVILTTRETVKSDKA